MKYHIYESRKPERRGRSLLKPVKLSPELANLMGSKALPRHEVIKRMWRVIRERNLYDPRNKQFAICDAELEKIMKVKRFRAFGMMKFLEPHLYK